MENEADKPTHFVSSPTGKRTTRLDGKKQKDGSWESHEDIAARCKEMGFDNVDECPYSKEINEDTGMTWLKAVGYDSKKSKQNRKSMKKRKAKTAQASEESAKPAEDSGEMPADEPAEKEEEMAPEAEPMSEEPMEEKVEAKPDYNAMKVAELRDKCKERSIPTSGTKKQLIKLLEEDDAKASSL